MKRRSVVLVNVHTDQQARIVRHSVGQFRTSLSTVRVRRPLHPNLHHLFKHFWSLVSVSVP